MADLAAGGAVQQGEDAQQRLVRVRAGAGGPAAEQIALLVQGDGLPGEAAGCGGGQAAGGSARMIFWMRAKRKNCRSTVSRRLRDLGTVTRNASMSCTPASAQSCLPR